MRRRGAHLRYVLPGGRTTLPCPSVQYLPRLMTTPPTLLAPPAAADDDEGSRRRSPRRTAPGRMRDLPARTIDCGPWIDARVDEKGGGASAPGSWARSPGAEREVTDLVARPAERQGRRGR